MHLQPLLEEVDRRLQSHQISRVNMEMIGELASLGFDNENIYVDVFISTHASDFLARSRSLPARLQTSDAGKTKPTTINISICLITVPVSISFTRYVAQLISCGRISRFSLLATLVVLSGISNKPVGIRETVSMAPSRFSLTFNI